MNDPIDELEAADKARTPGPWRVGWDGGVYGPTINDGLPAEIVPGDGYVCEARPDAIFIALCGTHVPTLLARLRAAEAVCEAAATVAAEGAISVDTADWDVLDAALTRWRELRP